MPTPITPSDARDTTHIGLALATMHFGLFVLSVILAEQGQGWMGLFVWPVWALIDFPWSILYVFLLHPSIQPSFDALRSLHPVLDYLFFAPSLIHGVAGTIWWAFLPAIWARFKLHRKQSVHP